MKILSIDTSCDETSAAVTDGRKVLSTVLSSQIQTHKSWGGVVPSLAKRAHEERIDFVVDKAIKKSGLSYEDMDYFAVTQGPGLAIALEVGILKAKQLALKYGKNIIPINHMAGHIYSCFVQNKNGKPEGEFQFPYLALLISGGHTEFVLFKDHMDFEVIGSTRDDAAGEALDKIARLMGVGYPGGSVIETLAAEAGNKDYHRFPRAMLRSHDLDLSFSGLKTAFLYYYRNLSEEEKITQIKELASSFQEAVFDSIIRKTETAIRQRGISRVVVGGGVIANTYLRQLMRNVIKKHNGSILFPPYKYLTGDNAAMIGVAAFYHANKGLTMHPDKMPDREPRLSLS